MNLPTHITQLTASDLEKMMAAGNLAQGRGIIVDRANGQLIIKLDVDVIIDIIWCFVRAGQIREGLSGAPCVVAEPIKNTRNHVKTDPNQY